MSLRLKDFVSSCNISSFSFSFENFKEQKEILMKVQVLIINNWGREIQF